MGDSDVKTHVDSLATDSEFSEPPLLEVDLGDSPTSIMVIHQKPAVDGDDDVPLLVPEDGAAKKRSSAFLKLLCMVVFLISVLMVLSSLALTFQRREESSQVEVYQPALLPPAWRMGAAAADRGPDDPFEDILDSINADIATYYGGLTDSCFNFYLDSLHHLRNNFLSEFPPISHVPGDFIKIRFRPEMGPFQLIEGMEPVPVIRNPSILPEFCSEFKDIVCRVLLDTGNVGIAVLGFSSGENPQEQEIRPKSNSSWFLPWNATQLPPEVKPTVIPVVHSQKAANAVEKQIKIKPQVIPRFCPHLGAAPETDAPGRLIALFPGKSRDLTDYFMTSANAAAENLDISASIFYINSLEEDKLDNYQKLTKGIKAIIFPERDVPEEVLHQFYCLGIPVFVPLIDIAAAREAGDAVMKCNDTDVFSQEIVHHTFYSGFPHVVHYSCFYELVEKLNQVDLRDVREKMWADNMDKNKEAQEKLENLHKEAKRQSIKK